MALDFVKGIATGIVSNNLRRVAGNLPGMLGNKKGNDTSNFTKLNRPKSKHSVDVLKFPIDVDSDPGLGNHGHYMMFYINKQDNAKLAFGQKLKKDGKKGITDALKEGNIPDVTNEIVSPAQYAQVNITGEKVKVKEVQYGLRANNDSIGKNILNQSGDNSDKAFEQMTGAKAVKKSHVSKEAQALHVKRMSTTRLSGGIAMYMPANVQVSYGAKYSDQEIGSMAERGADAIKAFYDGDAGKGVRTLLDSDKTLIENAGQFLLTGIGNLPGFGGAKELESMKKGRIISNRMELAFRGINKREFQYTFKMIPRNKIEADEIKKIVHAFKVNMLPAFEGGDLTGRSFIVPNTFDIEYMYNGKQNQFLHKISTCVLESMAVTYGGDRYKTYTATTDGAPPVETTIALNVKEMEMITRERVEDGF